MKGRVAKAVRRVVLVGGVVLAALGGGAVWLATSDWGQRWAAAQIAAALGPSVRFAGVDLTLWPPPLSVALDGVEILSSDGTPVIRARHVLGRVRLRALVGRPPFLARVEVDGFEVALTRASDGSVQLGGQPLAGGGGTAPMPALDASCPHIVLSDGRVTVHDERAGEQLQIEGIAGRVLPTRPGARLSLTGRSAQLGDVRVEASLDSLDAIATAPFHAEFEARDAEADDIAAWLPRGGMPMSGRGRFSAVVHGRPTDCQADVSVDLATGEITWRDTLHATAPIAFRAHGGWGTAGLTTATGDVDIAHLLIAGLTGSAVHAAFSADANGVTLHDGHWDLLGSQWRQSGGVRFADTIAIDGAVDADAVDGAALTAALQRLVGDAVAPLHLAGAVRVHAAAKGTVGQPLLGQIAVAMAEGTAGWRKTTVSAPMSLSTDVRVDGTTYALSNGIARVAAISDRDLTATAVDARFGFAGNVVQIDALSAQAFDGSVTASGTVPLHGAPNVTLSAVGINAAHLARAFLTGRREETGTAGDVDVTATLRGGTGTLSLRLASPSLTSGPVQIFRPASASGTLRWSNNSVQVTNGRAQLDRVRVEGTDAGNVRAAFATAGPGRLRVAPLTARAFGGLWTVNATLARDEIDATVRAVGVNLDPILAALDAGPRSDRAGAIVDLTLRRPREAPASADVEIQLTRGRFLFQDLTVTSPARGTATVRVDGPRWSVERGVVSAAAASYSVIHATQASARLGFDPDRITFTELRATAAGAPWQGSGRIDLSSPARIDGSVTVTRADPDAVFQMLGIKSQTLDPDGLDLSLTARTPLDATWRQALQGSGAMTLRGGYLSSTALLRSIVAAIVPSRALRDGGTPNRLTSLTQSFTLANGRVHTNDLTVDSNDYDLTASGTIGFDGQLNLDGRVTLTPNGIKKMFALSNVPIPGSGVLSLPTIPAHFAGTLENPNIKPDATALAGSTVRWFTNALLSAPRFLGRSVGRVFGDMRDFIDPPLGDADPRSVARLARGGDRMVERRIATSTTMPSAELALERPSDDQLVVRLAGPWRMSAGVPDPDAVAKALSGTPTPHQITFQAAQLGAWDSALLIFLERVAALAGEHGVAIDRSGLPNGVQRLLTLSEAVPERQGARGDARRPGFLARVGLAAMASADGARAFLDFIGQLTIAAGNALRGRARLRAGDLLLFMQEAGADALPIVTLISFLVGVIMAFVGAIQLEKFGAEIYVADLVGIAVVHEMGALMTGIIMAGRTGAAFAAQLGTMKVTQEIDALTTMGINPMEFLVLPRAVALCVMMPLLCLYADLVGILGGAAIAGGMLSINPEIYFRHVFNAVQISDLVGGVFKASVYGVLVAVAGCLRGMQSGASASAVGDAATSAVVTGIVLIVCACGLLAVVFYVLGI